MSFSRPRLRSSGFTPKQKHIQQRPRIHVVAVAVLAFIVAIASACDDESTPAAAPLTWTQLRNGTYPSQVTPGTDLILVNGIVEAPAGTGTRPSAMLAPVGAFGEIDGGNTIDSAVFLVEATGPQTWTTSLVVVLNDDGVPEITPLAALGDDLFVRGVSIDAGEIAVRTRARVLAGPALGSDDELTRTYAFDDDALVLRDEVSVPVPVSSPVDFVYEGTALDAPAAGGSTIDRTLAPRASETFILAGAAGQQLTLDVESAFDSAILSVQGLSDDVTLLSHSTYATSLDVALPATQSYSIRLTSVSGEELAASLSYDLTPADAAAAATPLPVPTPGTPAELALMVPNETAAQTGAPASPLASLSTQAQAYIGTRDPARGIAVVTYDEGLLYAENGDEQLETASVIKVVVMTCVMHRAEQQDRLVDEWELSLMWPMITYSDNDATDALWNDLGGGPGVTACLEELGAGGITPYNGPYWGTSTASATGLATLMSRLVFGDIVNPVHRSVALTMLTNVIDGQRWGIPAGAAESGEEIVGVKDGWYPDDDGWRVNSIGFVSPLSPGAQPYAIAVMTNYQSTQEYGIETIEGLAAPVYEALRAD